MEIHIHTKNLELNSQAEAYIQKKFDRLERHLKTLNDAKLEIKRLSSRSHQDRVVAQMTLNANGRLLRGEETAVNLFEAIDAVTDVMDRQIRKYKTRAYRNSRGRRNRKEAEAVKGAVAELEAPSTDLDGDDGTLPTVARTKRFLVSPMAVEDAIDEMELLGHKFFLFFNMDSNEYNVVYRREDGNYGILEAGLA